MHHEDVLLQDGLELLAQMRSDRAAWSRIAYLPENDPQGSRRDAHDRARLQLAWALERDFQPSDAPLLRFALDEEVKWRHEDPWQGIGETLEILAELTASLRDVQDVWVLARAKRANFDTHCGFDRRHICAGGVTKTEAYVRSSDHPEKDSVLELFLDKQGLPQFDDDEVTSWLANRLDARTLDAEQASRVWFERALALGRKDIASQLLDTQMQRGPQDPSSLRGYASDLEALERFAEASVLCKARFDSIEDAFERAGEAQYIARLERWAKNPEEARHWLHIAGKLHAENETWREVGLGRMFVEECFLCVVALGAERGIEMFSLAERFAKETPRLPLVALEAAVLAAETVKSPRIGAYRRRRTTEAKRIEKLCGK